MSQLHHPHLAHSPIPLRATTHLGEGELQWVGSESQRDHVCVGEGSWILFLLRSTHTSLPYALTLSNSRCQQVAHVSQQAVALPWKHTEWVSLCNLRVDPGIYRLRLQGDDDLILEQTLVAAPGCQTQVFLRSPANGESGYSCPASVPEVALRYSCGAGFDPEDDESRLVALARLGLIEGKQILPTQVLKEICKGDFVDPMLGLLAGHSLHRLQNNGRSLRSLVGHLRRRFDRPHPDVEALALVTGQRTEYRFEFPPMLQASWDHVVERTLCDQRILPRNGVAYWTADRIVDDPFCLRWLSIPWGIPVANPSRGTSFSRVQEHRAQLDSRFHQLARRITSRERSPNGPHRSLFTEERIRRLMVNLRLPRPRVEEMLQQFYQ